MNYIDKIVDNPDPHLTPYEQAEVLVQAVRNNLDKGVIHRNKKGEILNTTLDVLRYITLENRVITSNPLRNKGVDDPGCMESDDIAMI